MQKKRRSYTSSELVQSLAKIYGFEEKLLAFEVRDFLQEYLDASLFSEIQSVNIKDKVVIIRIISPLMKNDFRMRKSFFLKKFQEKFSTEKIEDLVIF
ncbi:hypothetical protein AAH994_02095 [Weeksellaceae bacterium A-14]|uniref:hypothetical protein n=1 Tax=Daejeonia sp. YH14 TaxID=3439042 RepID=UPI0031E4D483